MIDLAALGYNVKEHVSTEAAMHVVRDGPYNRRRIAQVITRPEIEHRR